MKIKFDVMLDEMQVKKFKKANVRNDPRTGEKLKTFKGDLALSSYLNKCLIEFNQLVENK